MCGSHGLRSKGPFVYEEIMHVPCYVRVPGVTDPGSQSDALATHVDLASTICALGGVDPSSQSTLKGVDLSPVLADPSASVRDHVLFAHDTAHTDEINHTRYAIRGFFDGRTKYARYYGVGGGKPGTGLWGKDPGHKLFDVDASFVDQEHEWYDLHDDPHELVNLAHDGGRRPELHENYERLLQYEAAEFAR
jgi:arylsulfatase A-like enzyme